MLPAGFGAYGIADDGTVSGSYNLRALGPVGSSRWTGAGATFKDGQVDIVLPDVATVITFTDLSGLPRSLFKDLLVGPVIFPSGSMVHYLGTFGTEEAKSACQGGFATTLQSGQVAWTCSDSQSYFRTVPAGAAGPELVATDDGTAAAAGWHSVRWASATALVGDVQYDASVAPFIDRHPWAFGVTLPAGFEGLGGSIHVDDLGTTWSWLFGTTAALEWPSALYPLPPGHEPRGFGPPGDVLACTLDRTQGSLHNIHSGWHVDLSSQPVDPLQAPGITLATICGANPASYSYPNIHLDQQARRLVQGSGGRWFILTPEGKLTP
jgi:hypothetical protein